MISLRNCAIAILSACIAFTSCKKNDNNNSTPQARANFINACLNTTALDVTINGTKLTGFSSLDFLKNSGYRSVSTGTAATAFVFDNTQQKLADTTFNYTASNSYSVFATGLVTAPTLLITSDDLSAPASGMAKVRLINLSTDSLNENLYVGNTTAATSVTARSVSGFTQVSAGTSNILVQDPNYPTNLIQQSATLSAGKIYTFVITGLRNGGGTAALTLTTINNN